MKRFRIGCLLFWCVVTMGWLAAGTSAPAAETFDVILRGGKIVDGTGSPWFVADLAVRDGRIARIGRLRDATAEVEIDVTGLIVAPGFIDMMGQTATPLVEDPRSARNLLTQGITTINAGEGVSAAPVGDEQARRLGWQTMAEYLQWLDQRGMPVNVVQTVGHTQVRRIVLGEVDRRPSDEELARMKELVREGMEAGAIGVSTALIYPPAVYASTREISELAEVAGRFGGRYFTHMRNEGDRLLEAIDEALEIGRAAGTPVHIFHLKAAGRDNWPKIEQAIAKIKSARAGGLQVTADIYPYIHNGLGIAALIHPRHFAQGRGRLIARLDDEALRKEVRQEMENVGGWENWYRHAGGDWNKVIVGRVNADSEQGEVLARFSGRSLAEIAREIEQDPWDTFFDLVRADAFVLPQSMTDANKIQLIRQEFISFCTDVGPADRSRIASHPRAFGAFPRLLSRYVRDLGAISLERAVAQACAGAANDVMAHDRGRLAEGLMADVIVFSLDELEDRATFAEPRRTAVGMKHVMVNGRLVMRDGQYTGDRPGRVLRGPGFDPETAPHAVSSGDADPRMRPLDRMMRRFVREHRVPGAALAVTHKGRIVHARGYGYADLAERRKVTADSLFRIASISKPITAVAVLRLVEQGKLSLDERVFDILDYEPHLEPKAQVDPRLASITVRHLLSHRGGWDRSVSFDAMFQSVRFAESLGIDPPAGPDAVIRCMMGIPLDFSPGERYAYSNLGYCLLGRVIEVKSGQPYEPFVQQHVLSPLGIRSMRIGHTLREQAAENEVRYYDPSRGRSVFADNLGQPCPWPYGGWYLEAMDSHGGWIASAADLARFALAFDDPDNCPVLSRESIERMHARPTERNESAENRDQDENENEDEDDEAYYSLGWMNREVGPGELNHWHTGSLSGTSTILVRRHDGKNWVVLFNSRVSPHATHLSREIDPLVHEAIDEIRWSEIE